MTRILMLCHDTQERVSAGQVPCGGSSRPVAHRYGIDTETEFWGPFWGPREPWGRNEPKCRPRSASRSRRPQGHARQTRSARPGARALRTRSTPQLGTGRAAVRLSGDAYEQQVDVVRVVPERRAEDPHRLAAGLVDQSPHLGRAARRWRGVGQGTAASGTRRNGSAISWRSVPASCLAPRRLPAPKTSSGAAAAVRRLEPRCALVGTRDRAQQGPIRASAISLTCRCARICDTQARRPTRGRTGVPISSGGEDDEREPVPVA